MGTGPEPESTLIANVLVALMADDGVIAEVAPFDSARDARRALELGEIDVLPSYTGAVLLEELGRSAPADPDISYTNARFEDARNGLVWLPRTRADATFAFFVAGSPSRFANLGRTAQLAALLGEQPDLRLCVDPDFVERPDGLAAVQDAYARPEVNVLELPPAEAIRATARGACIAGLSTATDGSARVLGLHALDDELGVFPAFVLCAVVTDEFADTRRDAIAALRPFGRRVTTNDVSRWNAQVVRGEEIEAVAEAAAVELLVRARRPTSPTPTSSPEPTATE